MKVFHCPHCSHRLSSDDGKDVHLRGVLEANNFSVVVPFVLSAELGNYESRVEGEVVLRDGARPDFQCPKCHQSLTAGWNADLSEILLKDNAVGNEDTVFFSRVYGTEATYVCDQAKEAVLSYGADKDEYEDDFEGKDKNFFGS